MKHQDIYFTSFSGEKTQNKSEQPTQTKPRSNIFVICFIKILSKVTEWMTTDRIYLLKERETIKGILLSYDVARFGSTA